MFACIIISWTQQKVRSSFYHTLADAIKYADRMPGIIEIEEIGKGIIWDRVTGIKTKGVNNARR